MKLAYIYNKGRNIRLDMARNGLAPKEFFLGALELETKGYKPRLLEIDPETAPGLLGGMVNIMLRIGIMPEKLGGGVITEVGKLLSELNRYDVVVGTTSSIGFALALFRRCGRLKAQVVVIHCGLLNNPYGYLKRKLTSVLLANARTVLYGEGESARLKEMFPEAAAKIIVNQFGVDTGFWHPDPAVKRSQSVLSIGNDGRRDYQTLISAAGKSEYNYHLITSHKLPDMLPANVRVSKGNWHSESITDSALRDLYRSAGCVVVALKESYQPSGQSVVLQALACGTPVIVTDTNGLWVDEVRKYVTLVKPAAPDALASAIKNVMTNVSVEERRAGDFIPVLQAKYSSSSFADRIEHIIGQAFAEEH